MQYDPPPDEKILHDNSFDRECNIRQRCAHRNPRAAVRRAACADRARGNRIDELSADADAITSATDAAFKNVAHAGSRPTCRKSGDLPLYWKLEFRAMTNSSEKRDKSVMMSSVMPSLKYSWPGRRSCW